MDRKTIAIGFLMLYVVYKFRQFVSWIRSERKKYRKRRRVTTQSKYANTLHKLCGCEKPQFSDKPTSQKKCGHKYPITYSPGNLYVGHDDYGAYYAVVVVTEVVVVGALASYIYWM